MSECISKNQRKNVLRFVAEMSVELSIHNNENVPNKEMYFHKNDLHYNLCFCKILYVEVCSSIIGFCFNDVFFHFSGKWGEHLFPFINLNAFRVHDVKSFSLQNFVWHLPLMRFLMFQKTLCCAVLFYLTPSHILMLVWN